MYHDVITLSNTRRFVDLHCAEHVVGDRAEGAVSVRAVRTQREPPAGGEGRHAGRRRAAHAQTAQPQSQSAGAAAHPSGQTHTHPGERLRQCRISTL